MTEFAAAAMASGAQLRLRQLTKAFGASQAVDRISLDVPAGAFVSLLGPSGSGKTTTLNLIAGFLTPDAGDILLDERSIADVPPHKRNIGMVFQSYSLFPHMTVAENVGFPLRMRTRLSRQDARQRIDEMLALVQLGCGRIQPTARGRKLCFGALASGELDLARGLRFLVARRWHAGTEQAKNGCDRSHVHDQSRRESNALTKHTERSRFCEPCPEFLDSASDGHSVAILNARRRRARS